MTAVLLFLLPGAKADELSDAVGMDRFTQAAEAYLGGYLPTEELTVDSFGQGAAEIVKAGLEGLGRTGKTGLQSGVLLLGIALACGLVRTVREELGGGEMDVIRLAGVAAVTAVAAADVHTLLGLGGQALKDMDAFSKLLLPTVTAACAAAGRPASAAAGQAAALLFFGLLLTLVDRLLLPMAYAYVAAQAAGAALGNEGLKRLGGLLKWVSTGLLSLLVTGFVLYLSVTRAVAGNADVMAQKAAKTAISGMIPVVGGILSDAAEAVAAGAGILRGTVGVTGLLAVLAICLIPFLRLGLQYLVYKVTAALTAAVLPGPIAGLIDSIGSAFALILAMVGCGGMILYVALITSIQAVSG